MSIRDDFQPYFDGNGLLAPNPIPAGTKIGSDNGPMFTSEYYVILKKSNLLTDQDKLDFAQKIGQCIDSEGMLCRVPVGQEDGQEGPDDYYGVLDGCKQLGNVAIPRKLLWSTIRHLGALNNENPGTWTWQSFLARQPQLIAAMISAAFPSWLNPMHLLIRLMAFPLYIVAAGSIFVSCVSTPSSDTDSRRLSWHLLQTVVPTSLMCKLASLFWYHRLYNVDGAKGMKGVAAIYYQPNSMDNPYAKYWITE